MGVERGRDELDAGGKRRKGIMSGNLADGKTRKFARGVGGSRGGKGGMVRRGAYLWGGGRRRGKHRVFWRRDVGVNGGATGVVFGRSGGDEAIESVDGLRLVVAVDGDMSTAVTGGWGGRRDKEGYTYWEGGVRIEVETSNSEGKINLSKLCRLRENAAASATFSGTCALAVRTAFAKAGGAKRGPTPASRRGER